MHDWTLGWTTSYSIHFSGGVWVGTDWDCGLPWGFFTCYVVPSTLADLSHNTLPSHNLCYVFNNSTSSAYIVTRLCPKKQPDPLCQVTNNSINQIVAVYTNINMTFNSLIPNKTLHSLPWTTVSNQSNIENPMFSLP